MPLGESIDSAVIKQIEAREAVYSKEDRYSADLKFFNSREGWVRVTSFVKDATTPTIAKSLVLGGAPGRYSGSVFYTPGGIDFRGNSDQFYNFNDSTGVRPMPGLTGFSVTSKNTYGTLREAQISFVVWSIDDLRTVEKLYFRLGFEVLIEWGHTYYLDSSSEPPVLEQPVFTGYEEFFKDENIPEEKVLNHIKDKRTESSFNQEGMLGYIKNFSWSFREDGGYDCSISVISTGEVIESLSMKIGSKTNTDGEDDSATDRFRRSDFHALEFFLEGSVSKRIKVIAVNQYITGVGLVTFADMKSYETEKNMLESFIGEDIKNILGKKGNNTVGYVEKVRLDEGFFSRATEKKLIYIPLRIFLAVVNIIAKRQIGITLFDLTLGEQYLSFEEQTSIDPYVAVLPKASYFDNFIPLYSQEGAVSPDALFVQIEHSSLPPIGSPGDPYFKTIVNAASSLGTLYSDEGNEEGTEDGISREDLKKEILHIMVSLNMIVGKVDQTLESDDEGDIRAFVKSVLSEINRAVADTIDLDITFDDDTGLHRVVDRKNLPTSTNTSIAPIITPTGTRTSFSSLSINSKISNKLGAQISIAAQAGPTSYTDAGKFKEWNKNLTSKIKRKNVNDEGIDITQIIGQSLGEKKDTRVVISRAYELLNIATDLNSVATITDSEMFAEVMPLGKKYFQEILEKEANLPKGLIPIELSFKMDGIGGLKIGQSFKLGSRKLLPAGYRDERFAFIITGLEHSFENQRWYTQVRAQTFLLRVVTERARPEASPRQWQSYTGYVEGVDPYSRIRVATDQEVADIRLGGLGFSESALIEEIKKYDFAYPHIILAQAKLEAGPNFDSNIFKESHNLFGMKTPLSRITDAIPNVQHRGHAMFTNWRLSVSDRKKWDEVNKKNFSTEAEYYDYLGEIYAEDKDYVTKLKGYVNNENLRQLFQTTS